MKKTRKEISTEAKLEAQLRATKRDKSDTDRKYRALQDELNTAQQALADALELTKRKPRPKVIRATRRKAGGEATAFAMLSDVHCEEVVPAHKVNYLNEHNPDISRKRVEMFHKLIVDMIRMERDDTTINNLVLWWGGDFFTNDMHGAPTAFEPMVAAMYAQDMLASGLKFITDNEPKLKVHVVGSVGNHSRMHVGKPVNQPLEQEYSLEWMMYHNLRRMFESHPNITFQFDNSFHSYVEVYDKVIRFNHGHQGFRYNKGQAGLHGPLFKAIREVWDLQRKADLTCIGW